MFSKVLHDDFLWSAISKVIFDTRRGSNGATMINCPMCIYYGETPDTRHRCGITSRATDLVIHCYNCGFKTKYEQGNNLSKKMLEFLEHVGVPEREIQLLNLKAMQYRRMIGNSPEAQVLIPTVYKPSFPSVGLPEGSFTLSEWAEHEMDDPNFLAVAEYLFSRGSAISDSGEYYWTPSTQWNMNRRLIIPFTHEGNIVGFTGRLIDYERNKTDVKYWTKCPPNYLYNNEVLELDQKFTILVEGPLDAKAVGGVSPLGAKLTEEHAMWLNNSGKTVIVLPDRDRSGQRLIDHAISKNWMVSFPKLADGHGNNNWWDDDIKDAAAATERYGKLYTLRSIIETATNNNLEINVKRKFLVPTQV